MAKQAVRRPYAVGIKRREEILDAAVELFSAHGYRGAAMSEIATRVDLTLAGLLHYFPSKEELLAAALQRRDAGFLPSFEKTLEQTGSFCQAVHQIVAESVAAEHALQLFVTLAAEATNPEHPSHAFFQERYRRARANFTNQVELAKQRGEISDKASGPVMIAVLDGLQLQWLLTPEFDILGELDRYLDSISVHRPDEAA